jgi:hypothetical protein
MVSAMQYAHFAAPALAFALFSRPALADPPGATWPPPGVVPVAGPPPAAPAPAEEKKRKHGPRLPGVLLLVLGGAGLGAGAIFGVVATVTGASARSQCNGTVCPPSAAPDIAQAKSFESSSYAAFIAGGVLATAGLVLTIVAPGDPVADEAPKSARLGPWIGPGGGGVGLSVSF